MTETLWTITVMGLFAVWMLETGLSALEKRISDIEERLKL